MGLAESARHRSRWESEYRSLADLVNSLANAGPFRASNGWVHIIDEVLLPTPKKQGIVGSAMATHF